MTYNYREQLQIVKMISLSEGERKTLDCPFCGGRKKFSVGKIDGRLMWNCYRATCTAKGSHQGQRSIEAIKHRLTASETVLQPAKKITPLPAITSSVFNHDAAMEYLEKNHCMEALTKGYIQIRYAPAEKRVLFYTADGKGAVGRSIAGSKYKWWTFGDVSQGYHVGNGDVGVVVEDVPSACSVSRLEGHVGIAMLGTSPTSSVLATHLRKAVIVLDKDASSKSVSVARRMGNGTTVRYADTDLKHMSLDGLRSLLSGCLVAGP